MISISPVIDCRDGRISTGCRSPPAILACGVSFAGMQSSVEHRVRAAENELAHVHGRMVLLKLWKAAEHLGRRA